MVRVAMGGAPTVRRSVPRTRTSAPWALRLATLISVGTTAWLLRRDDSGDLRGFFKGIGMEVSSEDVKPPENARSYRVDNSRLRSTSPGLGYRGSKNDDDKVKGEGADWEDIITGVDEGDGWLRVSNDRYLPFEQKGALVLIPVEADGEESDWKDAAFRRQMQRVADMQQKMDPRRKKTPQEILEEQRRKAVWKAMAERSTEQVFDKDFGMGATQQDGSYIKVTLEKPLGINFLEVNPNQPCGAMIGDIAEGMSAKESGKLQIGDLLVKVEGIIVQGQPLEEGIQPIIETEGSVELTFFRAD